jgi:hypothetical protein
MSHSLALVSYHDELSLVDTPTSLTWSVASSGSHAVTVASYEAWLRGTRWEGFTWMDEHAPGWSWDAVTRHVAMIDAFLAFAPGAHFVLT